MGITADLVDFLTRLKFNDFPLETIDRAKYFLLDYLGVAARGAQEEPCAVMYRTLRAMHPSEEGTLLVGRRGKLPAYLAAMFNGTAGHSIELDDVNNSASLHPAVAIFPTTLAMAQDQGKGPKEFITASIIGYEVAIRLGMALDPAMHYAHGFHPTATCGTLGAAAAAAKLLDLDEEQTASALGIAGSQAAGSMEYLSNGAWTKKMHPGWAAHSGITAAFLARNGYVGPSTIIEGKSGFLNSYSDQSNHDKVLEALGDVYHIDRTSIKPHACCRYKQAGIDGILQIVAENDLTPDKIKKIRVGILSGGWDIVVDPPQQKLNPRSMVDAQFSMPYGAAVAVIHRRAFIDEYHTKHLDDPAVKELMKKVECFKDPELDKEYPARWPSKVEIETEAGEKYSVKVDFPKGDPENPLTWGELAVKFKSLCWAQGSTDQSSTQEGGQEGGSLMHKIYSEERQEKILECVKDLEQSQMGVFYELLETSVGNS